jgi:hypothetical protein
VVVCNDMEKKSLQNLEKKYKVRGEKKEEKKNKFQSDKNLTNLRDMGSFTIKLNAMSLDDNKEYDRKEIDKPEKVT